MIKHWLCAFFLLTSGAAAAHSFNLGIMLPMSGPEAAAAQQALDGLMFATREQDGHMFEESDGHLGGLDVYVLKIDSESDAAKREAALADLAAQNPEFVSEFLSSLLSRLASSNSRAILVNPVDSAMWASFNRYPSAIKSMDGSDFNRAFHQHAGYAPNSAVMQGYIVGRIVAATVRALGEQGLRDKTRLSAEYQRQLSALE